MYYWNIKGLAENLKNGTVSQRDKMKYFLFNLLAWSFTIYLIEYCPEEPNEMFFVRCIFELSAVIIGVLLCYKVNEQGDNKEFIDRFICLSWPIAIRCLVFYIVIYFSIGVVLGIFKMSHIVSDQMNIISDFLLNIVYYGLLYSYYGYISGVRDRGNEG